MEDLRGGPLITAATAQAAGAKTTAEFVEKVSSKPPADPAPEEGAED